MSKPTQSQINKLDAIIAKIEALQMGGYPDPSGDLAKAKSALLLALSKAA